MTHGGLYYTGEYDIVLVDLEKLGKLYYGDKNLTSDLQEIAPSRDRFASFAQITKTQIDEYNRKDVLL